MRTYSKSDERKPLKKASRVEVAYKEDDDWDNMMVDNKKSRRGNIKENARSNEVSTGESFSGFRCEVVANLGCEEKKPSTRGKRKKTTEDVTPKKPKKLALAPASKSPTEEDCSYGWQVASCWTCSRKDVQLRLCSRCQVC